MEQLALIYGIAIIFYAVIPGCGAFITRARWRQFRERLRQAAFCPSLTYRHVHNKDNKAPIISSSKGEKETSNSLGIFRFFGTLQAIQGEDLVWLSNDEVSVQSDFKFVKLFVLPTSDTENREGILGSYPDETPKEISWNRMFSLPEKTKMFIAGELFRDEDHVRFRSTKKVPLLIVIYDCDIYNFFSQAIWTGRQRNEYWNLLTPGSLTLGSFALFITFFVLLRQPFHRPQAIIALTASLFPLTPLFPPGLAFYYVYRYLWKRARILRAERDLLRLPLLHMEQAESTPGSVVLPDGENYRMEQFDSLEAAKLQVVHDNIRTSIVLDSTGNDPNCFAFGVKNNDKLVTPKDPMAEGVIILGEPYTVSAECQKRAWRLELFSLAALGIGFSINIFLLLVLFSYIIR